MEVFREWHETGINLKGRVSGQLKTTCPKCQDARSNKRDTSLSVNIDAQVWNCHYCPWKGSLAKKGTENAKVYKRPDFEPQAPTERMVAWFEKTRGIKRATLEKFLISPSLKYIHKAGRKVDCIAFPYVKGTDIVNVKSRYDYAEDGKPKKTFTMEAEAELVFYNLNAIEEPTHCVIVEGEIDAMSVWQATEQPCVSVPNGASKGDMKMEYLDNCAKYFQNKTMIVLATDNDAPGLALRDELARRLGKDRCYYVEYPDGCKDMNEVLLAHGEEYIDEMFQRLHTFPIEGVITLDSVETVFDDYYENGFPSGDRVGYQNFDKLMSFRGGEVTTITGIPSHGKTEVLDEILERLARVHGWSHGIFAAENGGEALHYSRIAHRFIGKPFQGSLDRMSRDEKDAAKEFMRDRFFFINRREIKPTIQGILEKGREMVLRKGIKSLTIDPYNCVESARPGAMSETEYVSHIYDHLVDFAELYNVHVFLVAHPTKMVKSEQTGKFAVPTMYSISGSANFYNKTYNGISVYRDFEAMTTRVYVQKVKFDFIGRVGFSEFKFNQYTRRYEELQHQPLV
ncbi:toprim domain-containing protein [Nibribacter koreensis]|uniref:Bifunctional DNA primase/helicase n=1 Tax=Nibribacter koreensis TaxID=1084519 RepID=A0ABP8FB62_9BACT